MTEPAPCIMNDTISLQMKSITSSHGEILEKAWCLAGRYSWIIRARRRYSVAQTKMGETRIKVEDAA